MASSVLLTFAGKQTVKLVQKQLVEKFSRNDEQLRRDREDLALQWGAELKAALPQVVAQLEARIDGLEAKVEEVLKDQQVNRVFTNFEYEAAREAIDERRKMLAHVALGDTLDAELSVVQKARVERTIRGLDPDDVLTLQGLSMVPGYHEAASKVRAKLLYSVPSGDVLVSSGCVRVETGGGGAGAGVWPTANVTRLGTDILAALRSYTSTRSPPFAIPGREVEPTDRSESDARAILHTVPGLYEFVLWCNRRSSRVSARIYQRRPPQSTSPLLTFFVHDRQTWQPKLEALAEAPKSSELSVVLATQPYTPSEGEPYDLLRVEISGPHDLLRYLADDCEAMWT